MSSRAFAYLVGFVLLAATASADCAVTTTSEMFGPTTTCTGTENTLPADHSGEAKFPDGGKVNYNGKVYELEPGATITVDGDTITVTKGKEIKTEAGTTMRGVTRAEINPDEEKIETGEEVDRDDLKLKKTEDVAIKRNGDFTAKKAATVSVSGITAHVAAGISRTNGLLSIEQADRIEVVDGLLGGVEEFSGNGLRFRVEQARDVVIGCVSLRGLEHSDVSISADAILVQPFADGVDFSISDCAFKQSTFQARTKNAEIIIPRHGNADYEISEADLTCHGPKSNERVEAITRSAIRTGSSCFSCLLLGPGSTYWHNGEDLTKDFGLTATDPDNQYSLCLRKNASVQFTNVTGLVDFVDHRMVLSGKITYRRVPVKDNKILSLIMDPVYQGLDHNNRAVFELDGDFDKVRRLTLTNPEPAIGVLAFATSGQYTVYERHDGHETKRFGRFNDIYRASVIGEYVSNFGHPAPVVSFDDDLLTQLGLNDFGTMTRVTAVCDSCPQATEFENEITDFKSRLIQAGDRCGI